MYSIHDEARDEVANGMTDSQRDEAVKWIADNYGTYFKDGQTMKQAAYYGSLLDVAYQSNNDMKIYSEIGLDVYQVARDVYRKADTPDSEFIKSNLVQIKDNLEELGYSVD